MATSSILTNFTITEKEAAERFINALEEAAKQPSRAIISPSAEVLRDPEAIRKLLSKRKNSAISETTWDELEKEIFRTCPHKRLYLSL